MIVYSEWIVSISLLLLLLDCRLCFLYLSSSRLKFHLNIAKDNFIIHRFEVNRLEDVTLTDYLCSMINGIKKLKVKQWISYGNVRINGIIQRNASTLISLNDEVSVYNSPPAKTDYYENYGYNVIYDDETMIAVDVRSWHALLQRREDIPLSRPISDTLLPPYDILHQNIMKYVINRGRSKAISPLKKINDFFLHPAYSTGIYIFAKNDAIKSIIQKNWNTYGHVVVTLCVGDILKEQGMLRTILSNSTAISHYRKLQSMQLRNPISNSLEKVSIVEYTMETTMKNQLLRQLSQINISVVEHDDRTTKNSLNRVRQNLLRDIRLGYHIHEMRISHPVSGQSLVLRSDIPREYFRYLEEEAVETSQNTLRKPEHSNAVSNFIPSQSDGNRNSKVIKVSDYLKLGRTKTANVDEHSGHDGRSKIRSKDRR